MSQHHTLVAETASSKHRNQDRTLGKVVIPSKMWSNITWVTLPLGPTTQDKCCHTFRGGLQDSEGWRTRPGAVHPGQGVNGRRIGSGLMRALHYEDYLNNCPRRLWKLCSGADNGPSNLVWIHYQVSLGRKFSRGPFQPARSFPLANSDRRWKPWKANWTRQFFFSSWQVPASSCLEGLEKNVSVWDFFNVFHCNDYLPYQCPPGVLINI